MCLNRKGRLPVKGGEGVASHGVSWSCETEMWDLRVRGVRIFDSFAWCCSSSTVESTLSLGVGGG